MKETMMDMDCKRKYTKKVLPMDICIYALKSKKANQLRVFLALKYSCDGYFNPTKTNKHRIIKSLRISSVTLNKYINILLEEKWIIKCNTSNCLWIRGYVQLKKLILTEPSQKVGVRLDNLKYHSFKAFLIAVVIANTMRKMRRSDGASVHYNGRRTIIKALPSSTYLLANNYLAKVLKVSKTTAFDYKTLAEKAGYIKTHENLYTIRKSKLFLRYSLDIPSSERNKYRINKDNLYYQEPDIIESKVVLCYQKNFGKVKKIRTVKVEGLRKGDRDTAFTRQ